MSNILTIDNDRYNNNIEEYGGQQFMLGLSAAERQLLPKIQMAESILRSCIEIERTVNGSVQNEYRDLINVPRPFTGNSTIVQDAKDLANAITPGTCP